MLSLQLIYKIQESCKLVTGKANLCESPLFLCKNKGKESWK